MKGAPKRTNRTALRSIHEPNPFTHHLTLKTPSHEKHLVPDACGNGSSDAVARLFVGAGDSAPAARISRSQGRHHRSDGRLSAHDGRAQHQGLALRPDSCRPEHLGDAARDPRHRGRHGRIPHGERPCVHLHRDGREAAHPAQRFARLRLLARLRRDGRERRTLLHREAARTFALLYRERPPRRR